MLVSSELYLFTFWKSTNVIYTLKNLSSGVLIVIGFSNNHASVFGYLINVICL